MKNQKGSSSGNELPSPRGADTNKCGLPPRRKCLCEFVCPDLYFRSLPKCKSIFSDPMQAVTMAFSVQMFAIITIIRIEEFKTEIII